MSSIRITGSESKFVAIAMNRLLKNRLSPTRTYNKIDLLILTPNACPPFPSSKILLMPDELTAIPSTEIAISYGMSSKCSVTLSSVGKRSILAIQREIITIKGKIIEPQEIPISNIYQLSQYALMASSAALLILGISPESLA